MPYLGNTPSTSFATIVKDTFNGGSTGYTLSKVATTNSVSVFVENVRQEPTSAYSVSGTTLTFTATTPSGTGNIYVLHMNPTTTTTHPAAQNLTAVDGTFTGNIDVDGTANLDVVDIDGAVDMASTLAVTGATTLSGGVSGDVAFDTSTLKIDSSNNRVGIGTTSPSDTLHVKGFAQIESNAGDAAYLRFDNDVNSGGKIWRAGAGVSAHGTFSIYNQTDNKFGINVDSNGHVTMPNQPAFLADMSATMSNLSINTTHDVQFNREIFDNNADFNTSTYTFTAPVTGKYQINYYLRTDQHDQDTDHMRMRLVTSNRTIQFDIINPPSRDTDENYFGRGAAVLCDMDAGDTAKAVFFIHNTGNAQVDIVQDESHFSGFLVC